jgi:hypothetical protein
MAPERGCKYTSKGCAQITGVPIAQAPDRIYLLTKAGLTSIAPTEMMIVPAPKPQGAPKQPS